MTAPKKLQEAIDDCLSFIDEAVDASKGLPVSSQEPLPSLLDQCELISSQQVAEVEPIRTIHHFACTGGTLFAKCIASMPNVQLLSEVEPHSHLISVGERQFTPTDLIQLVRASSRGSSSDLETDIFLNGLKVIYKDCSERGLRLVLRDHAHSTHCTKEEASNSPALHGIVKSQYPILSVVTVRHPLDSFLSLNRNRWRHFEPFTLEEYSRRYLIFLENHRDLPLFKYEDLVSNPEVTISNICNSLNLPFTNEFMHLMGAFRLSGDSGRSSPKIGKRSRLELPSEIEAQMQQKTPNFDRLIGQLRY